MSEKLLLSADEAVARAVWRAGCAVAAAYPGTPSTEIMEAIAGYKGEVDCEWAVNEKVAMEIAIGASLAGARAFTSMKHVGLNVALDPLMTFASIGAVGGLVVAVADDPSMHSSQNEQDNRTIAKFSRCPLFEPSDSQEAYDMTLAAFELSEKFETPVFVRLTTRTAHTSAPVDPGPGTREARPLIPYAKNPRRNVSIPAFAREMRYKVEARTAALRPVSEASPFNRAEPGTGATGFVASGVAYQYVREVFPDAPVFKVGLSWPLPVEAIRAFAAPLERLVVIEESDPFIADQIRAAGIPVYAPETELFMMELNPDRLAALRAELEGRSAPALPAPAGGVPPRPPLLCAGCSHRGPFYVLSKLKATVMGDIGCYTLGVAPPLAALDSTVCMGASIGNAIGMRKAGHPNRRLASVMGDSTFFHSGMTGLLDAVWNKTPVTIVVLDNRITGMTGHQPNPGSGRTLLGEPSDAVRIADIGRAFGVPVVHEVSPYDLPQLEAVFTECFDSGKTCLVVVRGPCVLNEKIGGKQISAVDPEKCAACGACFRLGCPAIVRGPAKDPDGKRPTSRIDPAACIGCTLCNQLCKFGAISTKTL